MTTYNRRGFLRISGAALAGTWGMGRIAWGAEPSAFGPVPEFNIVQAADAKPVRLGVIGVGGRGTHLLKILLTFPGVSVNAVCDIDRARLEAAAKLVQDSRGASPEGYSKDQFDYRRMLERPDLDAVLVATPPAWHAPMAVDAMRAGKHVATEVPGARTLEECRALVETKEQTGRHYMLLENYCYACDRMMIGNMLRQGMFGEPYYAECSYIHDCNALRFKQDGSLTWRGEMMQKENGDTYPTHALGPVSKWMDVNNTDRLASLTTMESKPLGLYRYVADKFGADSPQAKAQWACSGMCVTLIKTKKERLITVYHDTTSPRPMSLFYLVQGTKGVFDSRKGIAIEGVSPAEEWEPWHRYSDRYDHPYWKTRGKEAEASGHGGGDYFALSDFVEMVRQDREPWIDVYDSVAWSAVTPLSQESIRKGGGEVKFPRFKA